LKNLLDVLYFDHKSGKTGNSHNRGRLMKNYFSRLDPHSPHYDILIGRFFEEINRIKDIIDRVPTKPTIVKQSYCNPCT